MRQQRLLKPLQQLLLRAKAQKACVSVYRYPLLTVQAAEAVQMYARLRKKAITMKPLDNNLNEADNWEYAMKLAPKANPFGTTTVKGSQFEQPLLEFPGSCPGCGETPYAKLITAIW